MTKNPFYNALVAIAYIACIVALISFAPKFLADQKDTIFIPIGMLSLLVLSVAVMAYTFFYRPITMFLDGEREKAIKLLLRTIGIFAGITAIIFLIAIIASR